MIAEPTPWFFSWAMSSTRLSAAWARAAVSSLEPSSTTMIVSTKAGMPATVEPTSASSL
jgi:hypothetical protein